MKTFELKSLNGKWYQGQLVIRYNLLNVLRVLILAALAAVALAILHWIVKGLIWCFVQLTPAFVWIGDNWWWLLFSLLGIVGLVWAWMYGLFRNLFKRRPKLNRPQHEGKRKLWPWLLLLALVLGIVLCWKSCSGDDKESAAVETYRLWFMTSLLTKSSSPEHIWTAFRKKSFQAVRARWSVSSS